MVILNSFIGVIVHFETFRLLERELVTMHAELAAVLGISEVSVKRYATDANVIPDQIARLMIALVLIKREGLNKNYEKLLKKYHNDTL